MGRVGNFFSHGMMSQFDVLAIIDTIFSVLNSTERDLQNLFGERKVVIRVMIDSEGNVGYNKRRLKLLAVPIRATRISRNDHFKKESPSNTNLFKVESGL